MFLIISEIYLFLFRTHVKYKDEDKFKQTHNWGNILLNTRWNHVFTPQLFSNTTLAYNLLCF